MRTQNFMSSGQVSVRTQRSQGLPSQKGAWCLPSLFSSSPFALLVWETQELRLHLKIHHHKVNPEPNPLMLNSHPTSPHHKDCLHQCRVLFSGKRRARLWENPRSIILRCLASNMGI